MKGGWCGGGAEKETERERERQRERKRERERRERLDVYISNGTETTRNHKRLPEPNIFAQICYMTHPSV